MDDGWKCIERNKLNKNLLSLYLLKNKQKKHKVYKIQMVKTHMMNNRKNEVGLYEVSLFMKIIR